MSGAATETLLAAGYGLFLTLAALGLDALARHSHRRAETYRTGGFAYLSEVDAWECPEGERLHRVETDLERRLARYRARAEVCNVCHRKADCTDSTAGREVTRAIDPWPHSEAGRFHRVIAVAMVGFGLLVIGAGAGLNHGPADVAILGSAFLVCAAVGLYLLSGLRATASGFPWPQSMRDDSGEWPSGARPTDASS